MREPTRQHHQPVMQLLRALSAEVLQATACFFGGGTRIVLELDEYRESLDVDFLCADQAGYRELRNQVSNASLGELFGSPPTLLREVRADMYGIRTYLEIDSQPVKFEIIREARIPLVGTRVAGLPVPCLDHPSASAEKFLANTDRGLDQSTRSRDLIDLAFMADRWSEAAIAQGLRIAEEAYGASVMKSLKATVEQFADDAYRTQCIGELDIRNKKTMEAGLLKIAELAK